MSNFKNLKITEDLIKRFERDVVSKVTYLLVYSKNLKPINIPSTECKDEYEMDILIILAHPVTTNQKMYKFSAKIVKDLKTDVSHD